MSVAAGHLASTLQNAVHLSQTDGPSTAHPELQGYRHAAEALSEAPQNTVSTAFLFPHVAVLPMNNIILHHKETKARTPLEQEHGESGKEHLSFNRKDMAHLSSDEEKHTIKGLNMKLYM